MSKKSNGVDDKDVPDKDLVPPPFQHPKSISEFIWQTMLLGRSPVLMNRHLSRLTRIVDAQSRNDPEQLSGELLRLSQSAVATILVRLIAQMQMTMQRSDWRSRGDIDASPPVEVLERLLPLVIQTTRHFGELDQLRAGTDRIRELARAKKIENDRALQYASGGTVAEQANATPPTVTHSVACPLWQLGDGPLDEQGMARWLRAATEFEPFEAVFANFLSDMDLTPGGLSPQDVYQPDPPQGQPQPAQPHVPATEAPTAKVTPVANAAPDQSLATDPATVPLVSVNQETPPCVQVKAG